MINFFRHRTNILAIQYDLALQFVPILLDVVVLDHNHHHIHFTEELVEIQNLVRNNLLVSEERIKALQRTGEMAFLDIELGTSTGLDLCRSLLEINPRTNVVYLTAYGEYSIDAWSTGASGFMLKPITVEGVQAQLKNLRHPFSLGGAGE